MNAMGQMGHLWNTSQWEVWMWDLMELTPPKTTAQLGHLESRGEWEARGWLQTAQGSSAVLQRLVHTKC